MVRPFKYFLFSVMLSFSFASFASDSGGFNDLEKVFLSGSDLDSSDSLGYFPVDGEFSVDVATACFPYSEKEIQNQGVMITDVAGYVDTQMQGINQMKLKMPGKIPIFG